MRTEGHGRRLPARRARVAGTILTVCLLATAVLVASTPAAQARETDPVAVAAPAADAVAVAEPRITTFGEGIAKPGGIVTGPDANLWFTNGWGALGRSTPAGALTFFPTGDLRPKRIALGSDGNLWFTTSSKAIGRMTPAGVVASFPTTAVTNDITAGPDSALWFTAEGHVYRMATDGTASHIGAGSDNERITAGPDGNVWTVTTGSAAIKRLVPNGAATTFPVPVTYGLSGIASGADGNVWFTSYYSQRVGKVTPAGVVTVYTAAFVGYPSEITAGADGNMWFSNDQGFRFMGRITPAGVINVTYAGGDKSPGLAAMTKGPDGKVWFLTSRSNLGTMTTAGVATMLPGGDVTAPTATVRGPDDAVWFTSSSSIGRIGPDRVITVFRDPGITAPASLAVGPDGNIWFVNTRTSIGRLTPAGVVTLFTHPDAAPDNIIRGPDGTMWFTDNGPTIYSGLGRITTDGAITLFAPGMKLLEDLVTGPDGNVWAAGPFGPEIYRMTPAGQLTTFIAPSSQVRRLAVGADGNLWFVGSYLGRVSMAGEVTQIPLAGPGFSVASLLEGPDRNIWFAGGSGVGSITPSGHVTLLSDPSVQEPQGLTLGSDGALWFANRGSSSIGRAETAPAPPVQVAATAGKERATVAWELPPPSSAPVTSVTVTANPGGATCIWTTGPTACTVAGLTVGTSYTFTVTSTNVWGTSEPSVVSNAVIPWDGAAYHPLTPERILDSRTPTGSWASPLVAGTPRDLQVTALGGASDVPASASAVVMNVTATGGTANSFVTAWPSGVAPPGASNLNFGVGQTIPNLVTVKLGAGGKVSFANAAGAVDLVADVVGYYDDGVGAGSLFNGMTPVRVLDSRTDNGGWDAPLTAGSPRDLLVRQPGRAIGVPDTATAVVANVTVTEGTADSFLSVWPSGVEQPGVSNLNFATGQTVPNLAVVKIGDNGAIRLANALGATHVVVDVVGWFDPAAGARFHPITPTRVLDDRIGLGLTDSWGPGETRVLPIAGVAGSNVPSIATDVVANVTATGATAGTFVTVFPHGVARPNSSNLNVGVGQTIPNLVTVKIGTVGSVDLFNAAGAVDLVADVVGYYAAT